ncbi:hypothetical protein ACOMHN_053407 [Nucella lapillus]
MGQTSSFAAAGLRSMNHKLLPIYSVSKGKGWAVAAPEDVGGEAGGGSSSRKAPAKHALLLFLPLLPPWPALPTPPRAVLNQVAVYLRCYFLSQCLGSRALLSKTMAAGCFVFK